jgi:MtN3 and saliva related transmembrane protein
MTLDDPASWISPAIGWTSSAILLATIVKQLKTQWDAGSTEGVSVWLFIGQTLSSVGFAAYSVLSKNWLFTISNSIMVLSSLVGCWMSYWLSKHPRKKPKQTS